LLIFRYSATQTNAQLEESGTPIALQAPPGPSQSSFPIQNLYQSARMLPTLPNNPSGSSQPFLGFSALAPPSAASLPTQRVNQARLASAATTIPRQQQVARRGSRSRGPARPSPNLVHRPIRARIENCLLETDPETIRVQVRVYPPMVCCLSLSSGAVILIVSFLSSHQEFVMIGFCFMLQARLFRTSLKNRIFSMNTSFHYLC
jgi:hypothetical protein